MQMRWLQLGLCKAAMIMQLVGQWQLKEAIVSSLEDCCVMG